MDFVRRRQSLTEAVPLHFQFVNFVQRRHKLIETGDKMKLFDKLSRLLEKSRETSLLSPFFPRLRSPIPQEDHL